jgi:hypothetical protein
MPKIELLIRRLETEEVLVAEFANEDECEAWLVERPDQVEVVKMVSKVAPARRSCGRRCDRSISPR